MQNLQLKRIAIQQNWSKYRNKIGSVMEKINSITNDIGGTRPHAIFIISNTNKDNIDIDINYSFDRYKSTPVMVKL